jgi:hypothetical protein
MALQVPSYSLTAVDAIYGILYPNPCMVDNCHLLSYTQTCRFVVVGKNVKYYKYLVRG